MSHTNKELYEFGGFRLDVSERLLLNSDGEKVSLPEKVFAVLCLLVRKSGSLVSKDELLETVWDGAFVEENNLDKTISALRRALGEKRKEKFLSKRFANTAIGLSRKSRASKSKKRFRRKIRRLIICRPPL